MPFAELATERTSGASDLLVALLAIGCLIHLRRIDAPDRRRRGIWTAVFGLLALSAYLGAVSHGLEMPRAINELLWHPLFLSLGFTVALFAVAVVHDFWGARASRRALPILLGVGGAFYLVRLLAAGSFLYFIVYEVGVMFLALCAYAYLAVRGRLAGAGLILVGVALTIAAAAVQATESVSLRMIWEFDHNGVFHLIQIVALLFLAAGVGRGLASSRSPFASPPAPSSHS